jgi:hypothetical protein
VAALYDSLNDVASALEPLLDSVSAKSDPQSVADAASLTATINALLTNAMAANNEDLETKLASDATARQRLAQFTARASASAHRLAASEANVKRFVSLATHVSALIVAGGTGNIAGALTALDGACGDLGI